MFPAYPAPGGLSFNLVSSSHELDRLVSTGQEDRSVELYLGLFLLWKLMSPLVHNPIAIARLLFLVAVIVTWSDFVLDRFESIGYYDDSFHEIK